MATKALTPVARRASHDLVSAQAPGRGQDWRQLFTVQDAQAIWQSLFDFVRSSIPDDMDRCAQLTQEAFLYLIACRRMEHFIEAGCSNEEIEKELLSYLTG